MSFSVTILGSSSALPTSNRYLTAHVLNVHERFFLIDCGEGTQFQLRKYKAKLGKLNHIFITHLHGDHIFGLPGLISSLSLLGRKTDLHIYANPQLEVILNQYLSHFFNNLPFRLVYHHLKVDSFEHIFEDDLMDVYSFPLKHRVPTCGFIFREKSKLRHIQKELIDLYKVPVKEIFNIKKGADFVCTDGTVIPNSRLTVESIPPSSYAFCSDTAYYPDIVPYVKGVDVLYHEATFAEEDLLRAKETMHSTASQAAKIAEMAEAKQLVIGHFSARYKDVSLLLEQAQSIFTNTITAEEGLVIKL